MIFQVINNYNTALGGAQRIAIALHNAVVAEGRSSQLIGLCCEPVEPIKGAVTINSRSPYSWRVPFQLAKLLRNRARRGDIVHVHLFPAVIYVSLLRFFRLIPKCIFIYTEHSTHNRRRSKWYGRLLDQFAYAPYRVIIAISQGTANSLATWMPGLKERVKVIFNGAKLKYSNMPEFADQGESIRIISAGRLHKAKNYETALTAISLIESDNFEYWIAGEGELREELNIGIKGLNLQHKVRLLGFVTDMESLWSQCDIFFIPSKWEGFGLSAVEAMNAGLPCIMGDVPGLKELVSANGVDGILVDPDEPQVMASELESLINDKGKRRRIGEQAHERSKIFGIEQMTNSYLELYRGLIDE